MDTLPNSASPASAIRSTAAELAFRPGVSTWITRHADRTPHKPAVVMSDHTVTYAELDRRIWQVTRRLDEIGVKRGDRVALLHENHADFVAAIMAIMRIGAAFVPFSLRLADAELIALTDDCEPVALITDSGHLAQAQQLSAAAPNMQTFFTDHVPSGCTIPVAPWPDDAAPADPFEVEHFGDDTPAGIFYTSGTTGLPKGAIITHRNIQSVATSMAVDVGFTSDDRPLISLPISVSGAMLAGVMPFLHLGCSLRILARATPEMIAAAITEYRPTYMASVPTVFKTLLDHPAFEHVDLTCFRRILSAAAPMPVTLLERFQKRGVAVFVQAYGLTESCAISTCLMPEDAVRKAGSIGKPLLYSDVRVFRADDREAEPGEIGELRVSGPSIMSGYWHRPDQVAIVDGWLHTGDLGYVDDEGYMYIAGRLKDMIVTGGFNVYPAEVENVIYQLPAVAEAVVLGVPDDHWGERVIAVVRAHPDAPLTEADVIDACKKNLADYKKPKEVKFLTTPFPQNATGKVMKPQVLQLIAEDPSTPLTDDGV